jgi:hypothetical protein
VRKAAIGAALLACGCAPTTAPVDVSVYPDAAGMPADVQDFIVQHSDCLHWIGEGPSEHPARQRQINRAVRRICPGVDARAARLRARYAADPAIVARLSSYEPLEQ